MEGGEDDPATREVTWRDVSRLTSVVILGAGRGWSVRV